MIFQISASKSKVKFNRNTLIGQCKARHDLILASHFVDRYSCKVLQPIYTVFCTYICLVLDINIPDLKKKIQQCYKTTNYLVE